MAQKQRHLALVSAEQAVLVHSGSMIWDGRAGPFVTRYEGGKTTVLSHSTNGPVLNDDQIILQREGDAIVAHGTPLGKMTSGPCQARVGALFFLYQAPYFELVPFKPADLVHFLWLEHKDDTFFLPEDLKRRAFEIIRDVCYQVPVYLMQFPKDYVDWAAIDAVMG